MLVILKHPIALSVLVYSCFFFACGEQEPPSEQNKQAPIAKVASPEELKAGESLAKQYCASCHQYVAPQILPKNYWQKVLANMAMHLGIFEDGSFEKLNTAQAQQRLVTAKVFPSQPTISNAEWESLKQFYIQLAPESLSQGKRPPIDFQMKQFKVRPIRLANNLKVPSFIKIIPKGKIAIGFSASPVATELSVIDWTGKELQKIPTPSVLTSFAPFSNEVYMSFMGSLVADDHPIGVIGKIKVDRDFKISGKVQSLLDARERPVHINVADLNQDGKLDLISSEFGKYLGGLYVYLETSTGVYDKKVLYNGPGAISTIIKDVNKDGLPDLYALVSQGREGIYLYTNKGNGDFEAKNLLTFPPYYGSSHFEIIDFDQDGQEDIIYANGDSGDFGMPAKPFHGIRFFKNQGNDSYTEEWFYPQQGTYKTYVQDFDQDGDYDIAAIGFFAFPTIPQENFLYLQNQSFDSNKASFKSYSFPQASKTSYVVMDAGDIDGDGDLDLVMGASTSLMTINEMGKQLATWEKEGGLIVLLENTLK